MNTNDIPPSYEVFERLCKSSGVKRKKVADELKINSSALYDWKAKRSAPKTYKLILIADYFGVDVRDFFEEE